MLRKKLFFLPIVSLLVVQSFFVTALAVPLYHVGLIVFKYTSPQDDQNEQWPSEPRWPNTSATVNLQAPLANASTTGAASDSNTTTHPMMENNGSAASTTNSPSQSTLYHYLPRTAFKLTEQEQALNNSKKYQLLLHAAWLQPATNAPPIHVFGGKVYDQQGNPIENQFNRYQPSATLGNNATTQWELDGTLRMHKDQYYVVKPHLILTELNPPAQKKWFGGNQESPLFGRYVMHQSQRMKESELHYFDHPHFGVIVAVYPAA